MISCLASCGAREDGQGEEEKLDEHGWIKTLYNTLDKHGWIQMLYQVRHHVQSCACMSSRLSRCKAMSGK